MSRSPFRPKLNVGRWIYIGVGMTLVSSAVMTAVTWIRAQRRASTNAMPSTRPAPLLADAPMAGTFDDQDPVPLATVEQRLFADDDLFAVLEEPALDDLGSDTSLDTIDGDAMLSDELVRH